MIEDVAPEPPRGAPKPPMPVPLTPAQAALSAAERRRDREHNNLVQVLATADGRAVLWRILEICNPYAANDGDSEFKRGIREGERRIGLRLITLIESSDRLAYANLIIDDANRQEQIANIERAIQIGEHTKRAEIENRMGYWERFRRYIVGK